MPQSLPWNNISQYVATVIAALFLIWFCRREKLALDLKKGILIYVFFYLSAFVGGRIFSYWETALAESIAMNWNVFGVRPGEGKLRWYGSMLFFLIFLPVFLRFFKPGLRWRYFDAFALSMCVFIIFIKQGCHFAGDGCYGIPTKLPWGNYYSEGLRPSLVPVHPTPVYDSLFHLFLVICLLKIKPKIKQAGQIGFLFFAVSGVFCFFLEFIRRNPDAAFGLTLAQWTYAVVILITFGLWYWNSEKVNKRAPFTSILIKE